MAEQKKGGANESVARGVQNDPAQHRDVSEARKDREDSDALVDEAVDESFPASDPPSFTPTKAGTVRANPDSGIEREAPHGDALPSDRVERERD